MSFAKPGPFEAKVQDKVIGVFFVIASFALIYSIYLVKSKDLQVDLWLKCHSLVTKSYSLTENAAISISGITVGKVTSITLQKDAKVRVDMVLDPQYSTLYKEDSHLRINADLGIDTVLSGSSLEFIPGLSQTSLKDGALIAIEEPKSLDDLIKEWEIEKLAKQVKDIVTNLETLSQNVAGHQEKLNTTLGNMSLFSQQLVTIGNSVPPLLDNINKTNTELQTSIQSIDKSINTLTSPLQDSLTEATALLVSARNTFETIQPAILSAKQSMEALAPTIERTPALVDSLNETSNSVTRLTTQLSNHWLLGGEDEQSDGSIQVRYLGDQDLYQINDKKLD